MGAAHRCSETAYSPAKGQAYSPIFVGDTIGALATSTSISLEFAAATNAVSNATSTTMQQTLDWNATAVSAGFVRHEAYFSLPVSRHSQPTAIHEDNVCFLGQHLLSIIFFALVLLLHDV